jgi:hypothetical protein
VRHHGAATRKGQKEMKIRKLLAVILLGWYLIIPRVMDRQVIPGYMTQMGAFDTAEQCEKALYVEAKT